jgi:hypothetical protein
LLHYFTGSAFTALVGIFNIQKYSQPDYGWD